MQGPLHTTSVRNFLSGHGQQAIFCCAVLGILRRHASSAFLGLELVFCLKLLAPFDFKLELHVPGFDVLLQDLRRTSQLVRILTKPHKPQRP